MELVVFRTNKKFDTEIEVTKDGIKNIVNGKTKIKLVHEMFFTIFWRFLQEKFQKMDIHGLTSP